LDMIKAFHTACLNDRLNCVGAVQAAVAHDARMVAALEQSAEASPRDLLATAEARAKAAGIQRTTPTDDDPAVGFLKVKDFVACALHVPGAGWWTRGRRGMRPVATHHIIAAYEVKPCHR
jgi:hypothetical protein